MDTHARVVESIYKAVDEINDQLTDGLVIAKNPNTILFGRDGILDSLNLVSLIVAVEGNIQKDFGKAIVLANERAMSQKSSPFKTLGTLADYAKVLLDEQM